MSYNNIKQAGYWKETADSLNYNFNKILSEITELQEKLVKAKGLFTSEEDLKNKIPSPEIGDWAIVGNTLPGKIYSVDEDGNWYDTGETGGSIEVELTDYLKSEKIDNPVSILDYEGIPIILTASLSPAVDEYTGENKKVVISWTVKRNDTIIDDLYSLTIMKDGELLKTLKTPNGTFTDNNVNKMGETKYEVIASTLEYIEKKELNYNQTFCIYIGCSDINAASTLELQSLEKQTPSINLIGTYTLKNLTKGQYLWICVPSSISKGITSITLEDPGEEIKMENPILGSMGTYKFYRSTDVLSQETGNNVKLIIK